MLTAHHLSKSYNLNTILTDISFSINTGERLGLIGPNGCGKTTLLRILAGEEDPDSGQVSTTPSNLRLGYLPQGFEPAPYLTVKQLLGEAAASPEILEAELTRLATSLAANPQDPELQRAYNSVLYRLESPSPVFRLAAILAALGLDDIPSDQFAITLSGGQKTRLSLALVLLSDPELLLLDEPTNHLDIEMLEWLEEWLKEFCGAALIVSHDRTFLERTVTRILDINPESHGLRAYEGTYTDYLEQVMSERQKQRGIYRDQVVEIRRLRQDIARTKEHARNVEVNTTSREPGVRRYAKKVARKAKSREKKLERFIESDERVEKPKAGWQMKLEFEQPNHLGKQVLILEDLSVGYPGHAPLLTDINLQMQAGQRIAFTGPNGSGKTTLLRVIAGQLSPLSGRARLGANVKLGYMSQEQEILDPKKNAVETIQSVAPFNQTETRNFLHYYLFSGDDPLRPTRDLSYGERSRLMLARLVAQGCNFLLLDEPINHLDIPSREHFEHALAGFEGTVLAVVHDRYFIQRFATELWVVKKRGIWREVLREAKS
jgi:ATP-binding cassette subfamily F protein 3